MKFHKVSVEEFSEHECSKTSITQFGISRDVRQHSKNTRRTEAFDAPRQIRENNGILRIGINLSLIQIVVTVVVPLTAAKRLSAAEEDKGVVDKRRRGTCMEAEQRLPTDYIVVREQKRQETE